MGSIPLAANNLRPMEQPPNALEQYARIMQIQQAQKMMPGQLQQQQQQIQATGLENQQKQMAVHDQKTLSDLYIKNNGNLDHEIADAPQAGVSPQALQQLQLHAIDVKTKTADLVSKQGANAIQQADLMQGAHDAVDKAPAEQKQAVYQQQIQGLQQRGVDISQMPPQYPGDDQFKLIGATVSGHKQQVEDAFKQAETAKNTAQASQDTASATKTNLENKFLQDNGGMTAGMAESKYLSLQTKAKQGLPIAPPDKAFMAAYEKNKTLVPTANFNLQNGGATGTNGQPSAIAQALAANQMKWSDAVSPRTPMPVKQALLKEVKGINPAYSSGDFSIEQDVKKSFTSGSYSQQLNAISTARNHMQTFRDMAEALDNGNVKVLNGIANSWAEQTGNPAPTNFNLAKDAFMGEVGKSFAGANVTLADRQAVEKSINAASSPKALMQAADTADKLLEGKQKSLKQTFDQGVQAKPNFGDKGAQPSGKISVTAPDGSVHPFDTQAQADAFKKLAHIQ